MGEAKAFQQMFFAKLDIYKGEKWKLKCYCAEKLLWDESQHRDVKVKTLEEEVIKKYSCYLKKGKYFSTG